MRYVMENIEAEQLPGEIKRRGISARQRLRVIVETLGDASLAEMVEQGGAFAFLHDEPDLYSDADIRRRNV